MLGSALEIRQRLKGRTALRKSGSLQTRRNDYTMGGSR